MATSWLPLALAALTGAALASAMLWLVGLLSQRQAPASAAVKEPREPAEPIELAKANDEAPVEDAFNAKAEETRRQLLADVSHELATPLTAIRGGAETLLDPGVPLNEEERQRLLIDILAAARRMNVLIEDLFDLTRLESQAAGLELERIDWASLCHHLVERYQKRFDEMGLTLRFSGPEGPAWVIADGRRLEQILENLLANALRYVTAPGRVKIVLQSLPEASTHRLKVVDDGPGFPAADLSRIFDRFYKSDRDRSSPGSGLGLAIVKELVGRHGGRVEASNRSPHRGSGAVISIELPAAQI